MTVRPRYSCDVIIMSTSHVVAKCATNVTLIISALKQKKICSFVKVSSPLINIQRSIVCLALLLSFAAVEFISCQLIALTNLIHWNHELKMKYGPIKCLCSGHMSGRS